ncbi:glucosidase II beta subunit-like protein-domain-containing protein [Podospora fimiseda]|uniref:Endoplasmic reticulum lectin n=1 Tax=Podospora fimiseda TaxID=252190 RepID=A0AAN7H3G7_9PEZI|nr:glucosidase II beta subunit-like protein-domain-containing protein [Podospora fimiseda]
MRRLNLVLLVSLQLCQARQPGFSIHEDLVSHPQFEVVFSDQFISETEALALLESSGSAKPSTTPAPASSQTDLTSVARESASAGNNGGATPNGDSPLRETYEIINQAPWKYLCSIPVIEPPPARNQTATDLAKAEEARELSRATARGWELMSALNGQCLYFMSGWWSYSFCYGQDIVQFHAQPRGNEGGPPIPDGSSQQYTLGKVRPNTQQKGASNDKSLAPPNSEIQVKGGQRYLVQRLDGGTICDLTRRPRTIEVQYHCNPHAAGDRISYIKEVTTCTYLMAIHTPRLCEEVVFKLPEVVRANPITCRHIIGNEEEESAWRYKMRRDAGEFLGVAGSQKTKDKDGNNPYTGLTIGGTLVGAQKFVGGETADGKPGFRLVPPRHVSAAKKTVVVKEILARKEKDATTVETMTEEELKELEIDLKTLEDLKAEIERTTKNGGWRLEVIDAPGQPRQFIAVVDDPEDLGDHDNGVRKGEIGGKKKDEKQKKVGNDKAPGKDKGQKKKDTGGDETEGSEEVFFKEEL